MSQEEVACGGGGGMQGSSGGDDNDKKGKRIADQINPPRSPLPMSDGDEADSDDDPTAEKAAADVKPTLISSLASLEAALPMKRSLSGHYDGKSKSFVKLSEMGSGDATDLGKEEHAVNKRRRLLIANQRRIDELERAANSAAAQAAPLPEHPPSANPDQDQKDDDVAAGDGGDVKQQQGDD